MNELLKEGWENWVVVDIALLLSTINLLSHDLSLKPKTHKKEVHKDQKQKNNRQKIRGSIFKRNIPVSRPNGRPH